MKKIMEGITSTDKKKKKRSHKKWKKDGASNSSNQKKDFERSKKKAGHKRKKRKSKAKDNDKDKDKSKTGEFVTFSPFLAAALRSSTVMMFVSVALSMSVSTIVDNVSALVAIPVGARIASSLARPAWEVVAKGNNWMKQVISRGYSWSWKSSPPCRSKIIRSRSNQDSATLKVLDEEVLDAIAAGSLHPISPDLVKKEVTVVSGYFAVPKATPGQWRPIIDLRFVNKFLKKKSFKMTRYQDVAAAIRPKSWMLTVDLTKAYFSIPIKKTLWRFLRISWRDVFYEFRTLCFGLTSAPR